MPIFLLILACAGDFLLVDQEGVHPPEDPPSCLELSEETVDFGALPMGQEATRVLQLANPCEGDLALLPPVLEGEGFQTAWRGPPLVPPGEVVELVVSFSPTEEVAIHRSLELRAVDLPPVTIALRGEGLGSGLRIEPATLDLGTVPLGCAWEERLIIEGTGTQGLTLLSVRSTDPDLIVEVDLPAVLAPGLTTEVGLRWEPLEERDLRAWLVFETDSPSHPLVRVPVDGWAEADWHSETHEVSDRTRLDMLMTLDRGGSMTDDADLIVCSGASLFEALGDEIDWRMAWIGQDDGCPVGPDPWIDSSFEASEALAAFETQADLTFTLNPYGAYNEAGFSQIRAALKDRNREEGGCLEGFRREGARLAIFHASDEPEQSHGFDWEDHLAFLQEEAGEDVVVSTSAGDLPSGCGSASPGFGYVEITEATGGYFHSICDRDFAAMWQGVADASADRRHRLLLELEPVEGTLDVRVDGESTDWRWEEGELVIEELAEGPHTVDITYSVAADCHPAG